MKSKLPDNVSSAHMHALQTTMVDRRAPDMPGSKPLMKATQAHAVLRTGTEINMLAVTGIKEEDLPDSSTVKLTTSKELTIKATWNHKSVEVAESSSESSVFGSSGVLAIPPHINVVDIPKMNALAVPAAFLAKYGAELIPLEKSFTLDAVTDPSLEKLYLIEYQWDADYIQDYIMKKRGGGGLFVETHPFPHLFAPLSAECGGALILGVDRLDGSFDFAAFEIPFGYTMKIGGNAIHGDSFFVGPYAIALTETELADSVLFKTDTPARDLQRVVQTPTPTMTIHPKKEGDLATEVTRQMMIDRIRHEKDIGFFKSLPKEVLSDARHLSTLAQGAYDQQYALVPVSATKTGF